MKDFKDEFTKNDWDHMHDAVLYVTNESKSRDELEIIYESMPDSLKYEAIEWGMWDTLFRDKFIEWFESYIKNEKI